MVEQRELEKNLDPEVSRLLGVLSSSQVRWDLVKFFRENPFTIHTAQGLASMIGRRIDKVEAEAEALVAQEVLARISGGDVAPFIYAYDPQPDALKAIELLIDEEREARN